jgi:hypothetical protein
VAQLNDAKQEVNQQILIEMKSNRQMKELQSFVVRLKKDISETEAFRKKNSHLTGKIWFLAEEATVGRAHPRTSAVGATRRVQVNEQRCDDFTEPGCSQLD